VITTRIEYCDSTVNATPFCTGCELYSEDSSLNICYASALVERYAATKGWPDSFTTPTYFPERIAEAAGWKDLRGTDRPDKPWLNGYQRVIFLGDIGDGFCPLANPWEWLAPNLKYIASSEHLWLLLTKWPDRMRDFFSNFYGPRLPRNIMFGTSITSRDSYWRLEPIRDLKIMGAKTWVSAEPLLDYIDLSKWIGLSVYAPPEDDEEEGVVVQDRYIDWVACGGATGRNAVAVPVGAYHLLLEQCVEAGVPFFFKNMHFKQAIPSDLLVREMPNLRV